MGIIVTGATGGLGTKIVTKLNRKYPNERIICVSGSGKNPNGNSTNVPIKLDLSKPCNYEKLEGLLKCHKVKLLINCSGTCKSEKLENRTPHSIVNQINVNLTSYIVITNIVLKYMEKGSHIINISSLMGKIPLQYYSVYSATKFGIVGFSESLRMELEDRGILVSCVLPSLFYSNMIENAKVPKIIKPVNADIIANEIIKIIGKHCGLKTIGLQSALSCIVERLLPALNRQIGKNLM